MTEKRASSERYVVQAVDRALDVLEAFQGSEETSLNAISKRVSLNKSRTFRLLCTLARRGYVERTPNGLGYTLGLKLLERAAHFRRDLKESAHPYMDRLRKQFNETVNLAVIHNGKLLYLNILESSRPFRMAVQNPPGALCGRSSASTQHPESAFLQKAPNSGPKRDTSCSTICAPFAYG
jgi:IclR family acetate operon transcriptional repressor